MALDKYSSKTGLGRHASHPNYTSQISGVFAKFNAQGINLSPAQAQKLMTNLIEGNSGYQGIRNIIENTTGRINLVDLELGNVNIFDLLVD